MNFSRRNYQIFIICTISLFLAFNQGWCQLKRRPTGFGSSFDRYYFAGMSVNAGNYFGDLAPSSKLLSTHFSHTRPGIGFVFGRRIHHSIAVRAGLNWFRVLGDDGRADPGQNNDLSRYVRNLSFRNDIKEFQIGAQFFLFPNYGRMNNRRENNVYLFVGGAIYLHEPRAKVPGADYQKDQTGSVSIPEAGKWVKLRPLGTEGQNLGIVEPYSNTGFSIPLAIGWTTRLANSNFNISLEIGLRILFTDYIDDVSTKYVSLDKFENDLARVLSDRSSEPTSYKGVDREHDKGAIYLNPAHGFYSSAYIGSGMDGSVRGNPDKNDMIVVTQLRLSYLYRQVINSKFR